MKKLLLLLLIIGCSTEPEVVVDCIGVEGGTAVVDECGVCAGANTDRVCAECGDGYVLLWDVCYSIAETDSLDLSGNVSNGYDGGLTGIIPPEVGNLTNLTYLDLSRSELSGSIPSEIWTLTNLRKLFLSSNQLTGSIPPEIGNLTNL